MIGDNGEDSLKRKREKGSFPVKRGRGRPPTAGRYVKLAAAKRALNVQNREEAELRKEKELRSMSHGELLLNMGIDLENTMEDMKQDPTADISNRARKMLSKLLIFANVNKNLKGVCQEELKQAAVLATAAVEVLRTRADNPNDKDALRQERALREELKRVKQEAQKANEEANRLRAEIVELRNNKREKKTRRKAVIMSSSDSSPEREQKKKRRKKENDACKVKDKTERKEHETLKVPMDVDLVDCADPVTAQPSSEDRNANQDKKITLPPKEE